MTTTPRTTFSWGKKLGIAIFFVLLIGLIGPAFFPVRTVCCVNSDSANIGNDLRWMIMNVLDLRNEGKPWPTSMDEYREQCRIADLDDNLLRKKRQVFVAWGQFKRADEEHQPLPVCVVMTGKKAVVGFTDAHFEVMNKARLATMSALSAADASPATP